MLNSFFARLTLPWGASYNNAPGVYEAGGDVKWKRAMYFPA